jgi:hypothetical protein
MEKRNPESPRVMLITLVDQGQQRLGLFDIRDPFWQLDLPPRGLCLLEFCPNEKE